MIDHISLSTHKWLPPTTALSSLLLLILFAFGVFSGCDLTGSGDSHFSGQALPAGAKTLKVSRQPAANLLSWQGMVRSRLAVKIAPKLNARLVEVAVHPGDRLKKGDVIARLDARDLRAAYDTANAALIAAQVQAAQARTEEKRIVDLYNRQDTSRQDYDAALAHSKATRAIAEQAADNAQQSKAMLTENELYAPFDGVVGERLLEPGDIGMPNRPVVTFYRPDDLRLEASIAENCAHQAKPGMTVTVRIDAIQQTLAGTVDEIAPDIDPQTRTQPVKVRLPHAIGLRDGQYGRLELSCQSEQQALLIPTSAILHYGQLLAVKVLESGQLRVRHIRIGKQYGDQQAVLSGLEEGETILVNGDLAP